MSAYTDFHSLADDWLVFTVREEQLAKEKKELKKSKDAIGEQLKAYMKEQKMDDFSTDKGTILYMKTSKKPTSCTKTNIKEYLDEIDWKKLNDADQLTEQIFSKMPLSETESLKRQKIKKNKEKDDGEKKTTKKTKRINY